MSENISGTLAEIVEKEGIADLDKFMLITDNNTYVRNLGLEDVLNMSSYSILHAYEECKRDGVPVSVLVVAIHKLADLIEERLMQEEN